MFIWMEQQKCVKSHKTKSGSVESKFYCDSLNKVLVKDQTQVWELKS